MLGLLGAGRGIPPHANPPPWLVLRAGGKGIALFPVPRREGGCSGLGLYGRYIWPLYTATHIKAAAGISPIAHKGEKAAALA